MSPLLQTAKDKIFSFRSLLFILFIALCYFSIASWLLNFRLVLDTLIASFPGQYKLNLLMQLVIGFPTSIGTVDTLLLVGISVLVGINILLIIKTFTTLQGMGKVKLSVGGATLIALVTAGCGACGFTLFSLIGISTSLSFLPFHGLEIHILSFGILLFSSWYLIRKLTQAKICEVI